MKKINFNVAQRDYKYYIFDWDDNILHMPTRIYMDKLGGDGAWHPHPVSTSLFSVIRRDKERYRPANGSWEEAFKDFQDCDCTGTRFIDDVSEAIRRVLDGEDVPGPSFKTFRKTLTEGRLFAIVTARGHAPETIRRGVELFIQRILTDEERKTMLANLRGYRWCFDGVREFSADSAEIAFYLGLCRFHCVTSPEFMRKVGITELSAYTDKKSVAIQDFVDHVIRVVERTVPAGKHFRPISIGFSDDDPTNVDSAARYINDALSVRFPSVKFCLYDTSDPALENGRKLTVSGQLALDL